MKTLIVMLIVAVLLQATAIPPPDNWFGFIIQLVGLMMPIALSYIAYKQHKNGQEIKKLETNTNSIKDQLVAVTDRAASAEGKAEGRAEQRQEAKDDAAAVSTVTAPVLALGTPKNPASVVIEHAEKELDVIVRKEPKP